MFILHKTNNPFAENSDKYLTLQHRVVNYLPGCDPNAESNSPKLPDYIIHHFRTRHGFLVGVRPQIMISMRVGCEIGGAHTPSVRHAKFMLSRAHGLPTVIEALPTLDGHRELDEWITTIVLRVSHG